MESFLNDLASASLSEEQEKRRATLEKKIIAMKRISSSTPLSPALQDNEEEEEKLFSETLRPRGWSCPPLSYYAFTTLKETKESENVDASEKGMKLDEICCLENEEAVLKPKDEPLDTSLYTKKKFERLRQAYLDTLRVPRRRCASEPQVRTSSETHHRQPNPEYIKEINTGNAFVLDAQNDSKLRKPNKKGFNVAWVLTTDAC